MNQDPNVLLQDPNSGPVLYTCNRCPNPTLTVKDLDIISYPNSRRDPNAFGGIQLESDNNNVITV